jgi:hypothetical protein
MIAGSGNTLANGVSYVFNTDHAKLNKQAVQGQQVTRVQECKGCKKYKVWQSLWSNQQSNPRSPDIPSAA